MESNIIKIYFNDSGLIEYFYVDRVPYLGLNGHSWTMLSIHNQENYHININTKTFNHINILNKHTNDIIILVLNDIKNKDRSDKINKLLNEIK